MEILSKLKLRVNLFYVFLQLCCLNPIEIKEHWDDMNRRYYNDTDPEMLKIFKELEDESNIS
jgi:hypothetical protein